MAPVTIPVGSLIIPMDTTYQNMGMWKAYGLVYRLLSLGIPVMWAIAPGKPYNGSDFTATAADFQTSAPVFAHTYTGGPFIIDAAYAAAAAPVITTWQGIHTTTVHRVTVAFTAPEYATLNRAPRVAVEAENAKVMVTYLNAAAIPNSGGVPWTTSSPDVLSTAEVAMGALLANPTESCVRRAYDIFLSPHVDDNHWSNAAAQAALDGWVRLGGHIHATCRSIKAIENTFHFLTTAGIPGPWDKGETGTFTVDVPDYGLTQAVSTSPSVPQKLPGGSVETWLRSAVTFRPFTRTMAHFLDKNGAPYDFMISGPYKGGTGAGTISYEGGHEYATKLPYLTNFEAPYLRFVYDAILLSVAGPEITVQISPISAPVGTSTTFTVTLTNTGGQPATNLTAGFTLPAGVAYVGGSAVPPFDLPPMTWVVPSLGPGDTRSFQVTFTPTSAGENPLVSYTATYSDTAATGYSLATCASINAQPAAVAVVTKGPDPQGAYPNQNATWTVNTANTGTISLDSAVLTDTIPAGLTFVSSVPAPSSITPGPGGTTVLTYNLGNIAVGPGPSISITVLTPPATTANFTNTATLTGTDIFANPYSVTATALLIETDRAPVVDITSPLTGDLLSGITTITWTASDPDGDPLTYDVFYSPDCSGSLIPIATGITGTSIPWNTSLLNGPDFCITVVASDGLRTGQDTEGPFVVDNTPPAVTILTPAPEGSTICGLEELTSEATDNVGVVSVTYAYSLDGGATWNTIGTAIGGPPWVEPFETNLLPDGPVLIRATATDQVGLTGTDVNSYVIDNTPPTAAILSPADGSRVSGTVTVLGTASDNIALNRVEWRIDGVLMATQTFGPFDYEWNTIGLTEGPHTFTLTAYDNCGNTAVATATFIVDNLPDHAVQVGVDGEIIIPPEKPDAEQLLRPVVQIEVTGTSVVRTNAGGKVIVVGVVHLLIPYVAAMADQAVHAVKRDLPFQTFVPWPELPAGSPVKVTVLLESAQFKLVDPRTIGKYIVFQVGVERA